MEYSEVDLTGERTIEERMRIRKDVDHAEGLRTSKEIEIVEQVDEAETGYGKCDRGSDGQEILGTTPPTIHAGAHYCSILRDQPRIRDASGAARGTALRSGVRGSSPRETWRARYKLRARSPEAALCSLPRSAPRERAGCSTPG